MWMRLETESREPGFGILDIIGLYPAKKFQPGQVPAAQDVQQFVMFVR
jgi:hypothetical protein